MQIGWFYLEAHFFKCFAAGADVRGFARVGFQFAAARTPHSPVRLLRPLQQEHFILLVKKIKERRNSVRQRHDGESNKETAGKQVASRAERTACVNDGDDDRIPGRARREQNPPAFDGRFGNAEDFGGFFVG